VIERLIDIADDFAERFRWPLSILAVGWVVLTCASLTGFVHLPSFMLIGGKPGLIGSGLFNGLWWGLLYPRTEERRKQRSLQTLSTKVQTDG